MNTKRCKIIALLIVAALTLLLPAVYAAPSGSEGCPAGKGAWDKKGPGPHAIFKDLNLTGEQKKMLEENKNKHAEEMKALFNAMKETRTSMRRELQKEKLDMVKIGEINNEMKKLEAQMSDQRLAGILEVRKILSPEQFKKFIEKMGEGPEHFKEHKGWGKKEDKKQ